VATGEQGVNSLAVARILGDDGTLGGLVGRLAGGAGGAAKLGTHSAAATLGTKALAATCVNEGVLRAATAVGSAVYAFDAAAAARRAALPGLVRARPSRIYAAGGDAATA